MDLFPIFRPWITETPLTKAPLEKERDDWKAKQRKSDFELSNILTDHASLQSILSEYFKHTKRKVDLTNLFSFESSIFGKGFGLIQVWTPWANDTCSLQVSFAQGGVWG